jgi:AcrR family transcriptional regulator
VDAGIQMGLQRLTMKRLAAKLKVSVPTLYQYVADSDEVRRLVVDRMLAEVALPEDTDQEWSVYVGGMADALSTFMSSDPHVLPQLLQTDVGKEAEIALAERFFRAADRRGFPLRDAGRLLEAIAIVSYGAAVLKRRDAIRFRGKRSPEQAMRKVLSQLGGEERSLARRSRYFIEPRRRAREFLAPFIEEIRRHHKEPNQG